MLIYNKVQLNKTERNKKTKETKIDNNDQRPSKLTVLQIIINNNYNKRLERPLIN